MAKTNQSSVPAFGMKDKLGYMFGDFGNDFTFILSSTFMMKFYTETSHGTICDAAPKGEVGALFTNPPDGISRYRQ